MTGSVDFNELDQIGTHGLGGKVERGIVTIAGPCGASHKMNYEAARELHDWLSANVPAAPEEVA